MKKTVALLLMLTLLLTVFIGCTSNEKPEKESENYSQVDADIENTPETNTEPEIEPEQPVEPESEPETLTEDEAETESVDEELSLSDDLVNAEGDEEDLTWKDMKWWSGEDAIPSENDGHFVSFWPEVLPNKDRQQIGLVSGGGTPTYDATSFFLYDFSDPLESFDYQFYNAFVGSVTSLYFGYYNQDENGMDCAITPDEFHEFIETVKSAGYTDNAVETETSYYCEKYGVGISIVFGKEFPWVEDDERLVYSSSDECCYIKLQLIDPDYVFDLDAIKAEEYQRWLESHENIEE